MLSHVRLAHGRTRREHACAAPALCAPISVKHLHFLISLSQGVVIPLGFRRQTCFNKIFHLVPITLFCRGRWPSSRSSSTAPIGGFGYSAKRFLLKCTVHLIPTVSPAKNSLVYFISIASI